jgi:hypothetical protein
MKRHPLDIVSLVGGLLFMGLGFAFLLDALDKWSADVTWVPPIVLIALGLAGVLSTVGRRGPGDVAAATPSPGVEPAEQARPAEPAEPAERADATDEWPTPLP